MQHKEAISIKVNLNLKEGGEVNLNLRVKEEGKKESKLFIQMKTEC